MSTLALPELPPVKRADLDAAAERLKNWGKWGLDDQIDNKGPQGGKTKFATPGQAREILGLRKLAPR